VTIGGDAPEAAAAEDTIGPFSLLSSVTTYGDISSESISSFCISAKCDLHIALQWTCLYLPHPSTVHTFHGGIARKSPFFVTIGEDVPEAAAAEDTLKQFSLPSRLTTYLDISSTSISSTSPSSYSTRYQVIPRSAHGRPFILPRNKPWVGKFFSIIWPTSYL